MFSNKHLIERLNDGMYQGQLVIVEFSCGDLMKEACGKLVFIGNKCDNYLELCSPFDCKKVVVKTFSICGEIDKKCVRNIIIPLCDVSSVERIC